MYDLEQPFQRLVHHFIFRIFHGAGEGDDLQFSIPALLGLLSTPSAFGAITLLNKYSTLLLFLTHRPAFDVYRASIPDEYFFIVYSMVVTGAVVILKWNRLFPDRQDYDNLAALPISIRQIFSANLLALLFLAGIFAIDINAAACVMFPWAVTSRYDTFAAYFPFFVGNLAAVLLASFFACFGLLSVLGLTLLVVPQRYLRRVSLSVRILAALALIAILGSAFSIPPLIMSNHPPAFAQWLPTVWFLDMQQAIIGRGAPFTGSGFFGVEVTVGLFLFALAVYGLTYYHQFTRIPEQTSVHPSGGRDQHSLVRRILDSTVLRTPFQRATYHFSVKTLFRSERHCLLFGAALSVGFFLAAQGLSDALASPLRIGIDSRLLSIALILSYFVVCTSRALFDLPADPRANWLFQSILGPYQFEARSVATKVTMTMVVPWLILLGLPLHVAAWGWRTGFLHTGYVLLCSFVLSEVLLVGFRKIPFTCMQTASKDRVLVMIIFFMVGLTIFSTANARFERTLLENPFRFLMVIVVAGLVLRGIRAIEGDRHPIDRTLLFEDRPAAVIQLLNLSR